MIESKYKNKKMAQIFFGRKIFLKIFEKKEIRR